MFMGCTGRAKFAKLAIVSLVNENVTPYCYVKMSSPVREEFCGGREAG